MKDVLQMLLLVLGPLTLRRKETTMALRMLAAIVLVSGLNSCSEDHAPVKKPSTLIEKTALGSYTAPQLTQLVAASGLNISPAIVKYDVKVYKVTYHTQYKGGDVTASGIVVVPETSHPLSMVSVQHGTIIAHEDAPSQQPLLSEDLVQYAAVASIGFITVVPDYLGFGSSSSIVHPYYVEDLAASSVIDNLKAAADLASSEAVNFNKKLFLVGYSEGGYVTMAVHKYLDQNDVADFNLIASFPAAGGYDVKGMQELLFDQQTYSNPFYIAYVAFAYETTFDWKQPLTDWFNEAYATAIPGLFDGALNGTQINASLTDTIPRLMSNDLLLNIDVDSKYEYMVNAFRENSLTDWVPLSPMYMYHGDADITVPYSNSQSVYQQLLDNGASPDVLHFITLPGADHGSGLEPYIEDVIPKIMSLNF